VTLDLAVCTVISKPGLAGARVLAEAVRRQHPDSRVFVLLADRRDGYFAPDREAFELVELPDLRLHDLARLCFAYCPPELRAALQPRFLRHLLFERGVPKLLYLDPRVLVLGDLRPLAGLLEEHSVLLFPESADAERPVRKGSEDQALLAEGVYTTRVMGLRADARARHLLEWWGCRVQDVRAADEDAESVEQPWLALVPARFDGVRVVHEPGHAVPPDGGRARKVEIRSEGVVIDGERVHLLPVDTAVDCLPPAAGLSLAERHDERLLAAGRAETEQWPFASPSSRY
jgi:hypothetical protein